MRYLFLDIDGPLNTGRNDFLDPDRYGHHFDDAAVRNLRRIVEETGAKIVVSSSWRHMGLERIREIWKAWGLIRLLVLVRGLGIVAVQKGGSIDGCFKDNTYVLYILRIHGICLPLTKNPATGYAFSRGFDGIEQCHIRTC